MKNCNKNGGWWSASWYNHFGDNVVLPAEWAMLPKVCDSAVLDTCAQGDRCKEAHSRIVIIIIGALYGCTCSTGRFPG